MTDVYDNVSFTLLAIQLVTCTAWYVCIQAFKIKLCIKVVMV